MNDSSTSMIPDKPRLPRTSALEKADSTRPSSPLFGSSVSLVLARGVSLVVNVVATSLLARLLLPEAFGLIAMAMSPMAFALIFRDFGFLPAIVYQTSVDDRLLSSAFWISFKRNIYLFLIILCAGPGLAWFYRQPELAEINALLALGVFVSGTSYVHVAILHRKMRFGAIALQDGGGTIVGAIVGVALAQLGIGYWALVGKQLAEQCFRATIAWIACSWRPFRYDTVISTQHAHQMHQLRTYGQHTLAARVLNSWRELDAVLIGRLLGGTVLGTFSVAKNWTGITLHQFLLPIKPFVVSNLCRLRHDEMAYRDFARTAFQCIFSVVLPSQAFLFLCADELVRVVLGEAWQACGPILRILAVASVLDIMTRLTTWIYLSVGETQRRLKWLMTTVPLAALAVVIGIPWGVLGVVTGYALAYAILLLPGVEFCLRQSPLRRRDYWLPLARPFIATVIASVLVRQMVPSSFQDATLSHLAIGLSIFIMFYTITWGVLPGGWRAFRKALRMMAGE